VFEAETLTLAQSVLDACRARNWRLATAESCTGGLVAGALTAIAGSSDVVERGFVAYSNEAKSELLGVPPEMIAAHGAISAETAAAMANGAIAGALAGTLLARIVRGSLKTAHFGDADILANIARYAVIAFAVVAALSQLEIAPAIVNTLWMATVGSVALAFALAFGLGARDAAGSLASGRLIRTELQPGTRVQVNGQPATVERVGGVYTSLRVNGQSLQVPNAELVRPSAATAATSDGQQLPPPASGQSARPAPDGQTALVGPDGRSQL